MKRKLPDHHIEALACAMFDKELYGRIKELVDTSLNAAVLMSHCEPGDGDFPFYDREWSDAEVAITEFLDAQHTA